MKTKDWAAFIGLGLMWGTSFFWIKIALDELGPFTLVALRLLFAALGLGLLAIFRKSKLPKGKAEWGPLALLGLFNVAFPFVLTSVGEIHIDSGVAAIMLSTTPLLTTLIVHFYMREDKVDFQRGLGLVVGFAGVVILILRDIQGNLESGLLGLGALLAAAFFYSSSGVYAKRKLKNISVVHQSLIPILVAELVLWGAVPMVESPIQFPQSGLVWLAIIWLGLLGSGVAFLLYFYLLHAIGPTRSSMVTYTFPLTGVVMGVLFLNESLDPGLLLGAGLVVGSLLIVNRR